jgi:hypothetical protein
MYGIDAFQLVPNGERADFTSDILMALPSGETVSNPNWSERVAQKMVAIISCPVFAGETGLRCLHYAMKMAKYSRMRKARTDGTEVEVPPLPTIPVGNLHEDWGFLERIQRATEAYIREWGGAVSEDITYRDLEAVADAWDLYRTDTMDLSLEPLKKYQNRLPRMPRGTGNEETLSQKKAAILRARANNIPSPENGIPSRFDATPERPRSRSPPRRRLRGIHQLRSSRSLRRPGQAESSSDSEQDVVPEVASELRESPDHVDWHRLDNSPRRGHYAQSSTEPEVRSSRRRTAAPRLRHSSRHSNSRQYDSSPEISDSQKSSPSPRRRHPPGHGPPPRSNASPELGNSLEVNNFDIHDDSDPFVDSPRRSGTQTDNAPRLSRPIEEPTVFQSIAVDPDLMSERAELGNQAWEDLWL